MRNCFYYWLIEPVRNTLKDSGSLEPAFSVPIRGFTEDAELCLFTDERDLPEFARLSFQTENDVIDEKYSPMLLVVKEHLLSVLRLSYSAEAALFPRPIWTFADVGQNPSINIKIDFTYKEALFDAEATRNLFTASFDYREEVRLIIDGADNRLPLQYRFLSLYRFLEMFFRPEKKWDNQALTALLSPYEEQLKTAGIKRKPLNELHAMRDSCAHIRNNTQFGVTHLNHKQAAAVERFLPVMLEASIELLNSRTGNQFKLGQRPQPTL